MLNPGGNLIVSSRGAEGACAGAAGAWAAGVCATTGEQIPAIIRALSNGRVIDVSSSSSRGDVRGRYFDCALMAARSASLRTVITPIWLDR